MQLGAGHSNFACQGISTSQKHSNFCSPRLVLISTIILLSLPLIAASQNISYKHPGASLSWQGGRKDLCLTSCLAAGGVVVEVLMQSVSMKSILVLSGKWDLGVSTPCFLGGHCKD